MAYEEVEVAGIEYRIEFEYVINMHAGGEKPCVTCGGTMAETFSRELTDVVEVLNIEMDSALGLKSPRARQVVATLTKELLRPECEACLRELDYE